MQLDFTSGAANTVNSVKEIIFSDNDPTSTTNPSTTDIIWVNRTTGQIFTCLDNTQDNNVWQAIPLNAGGDSNIKHSDADPTATENLSKGTIWVNDTSGKIFICVDDTQDNNIWVDTGNYDGIKHSTNEPTITENLQIGSVWINDTNGKIYICTDDTKDNNVWEGYKPTIKIAPTTADIVDFFGDGSGIALYQFDNSPNDTGGVYNGVEQGNVEYTTGKFKQALLLNGSDAYIDLGNKMTGAYYSFSFWADWNGVNQWERLFDFGESNGSSWQTLVSRYKDTNQLCYRNGNNNINSDNNYIVNGELHHYAMVQDGGTVKFYRDGDLFSTASTSETPQKHSRSYCYIGKSNWDDPLYKGKIDQLRIFNRTLTDDEINQLYNER